MILALNIDFFKVTICRMKCIILDTVAGVGQTTHLLCVMFVVGCQSILNLSSEYAGRVVKDILNVSVCKYCYFCHC